MNRIINDYGAVNSKSLLLAEIQSTQEAIENRVRDIIANNDLTPEEIICFEHKLISTVTAECAVGILRKAINMRKAEREADKRTVNVEATTTTSEAANLPVGSITNDGKLVTKRGCSTSNRKTPEQWCEKFGVRVIDPDGWNRAAADWNAEWNHPITQDMFISRFQHSTTGVVDREKYKIYRHLFQ